ncbi:MAG: hypothetical protein KF838_12475 [Phycisphaeraceae bacterium]|nr:MAG: hypothetical protein KF838_12475 [Phycisphaeraceae bacterium]
MLSSCLIVAGSLLLFTPPPATPPASPPPPPTPPAATPPASAPEPPAEDAALRPNLLLNPSFEGGMDPWFSFAERNTTSWGKFAISDTVARTGTRSAHLEMDSTKYRGRTRIHGAVQEFKTTHAPETIGGWYKVENWQRGTPKQYLQVVVILWNIQERVPAIGNARNVQIAYTLAGVEEAPLSISNRKFILSGPPEPVQGEWVHFEINPRTDFKAHWGVDFSNFEFCRVLFEVRFDSLRDEDPPVRGDVYYDDLYAHE